MKGKFIFTLVFLLLTLITPILFLLRIIEANVAFPIIFTMLGIQQVSIGIFMPNNEVKKVRVFNFIFGGIFIIFGLGVVLPYYLFFK